MFLRLSLWNNVTFRLLMCELYLIATRDVPKGLLMLSLQIDQLCLWWDFLKHLISQKASCTLMVTGFEWLDTKVDHNLAMECLLSFLCSILELGVARWLTGAIVTCLFMWWGLFLSPLYEMSVNQSIEIVLAMCWHLTWSLSWKEVLSRTVGKVS